MQFKKMEVKNKNKRFSKPLILYDPIYEKIIIKNDVIKKLIYTKELQRLKHIKQLGIIYLLLSSSCHNRFAHSIGVYYLTNKIFNRKHFRDIEPKEKTEVEIAALLHDLGHGPGSHLFEEFAKDFSHEEYTVAMIKNPDGDIYPILKENGYNIERICNLILNKTKNDWAQSFISNQFDFDRLDYLLRDRYFLGLSNTGINLTRLIDSLVIVENKLVLKERVLLDIENYLLFRFYVHKLFFINNQNNYLDNLVIQIFQRMKDLHKVNHKFNFDLQNFDEIIAGNKISLDNLYILDDHSIFSLFKRIYQKTNDQTLWKLVQLLIYPKKAMTFSTKIDPKYLEQLKKRQFDPKYFTCKKIEKITIYDTKNKEIYLLTENKEVQPFSKISLIFNETKVFEKKIEFICKI